MGERNEQEELSHSEFYKENMKFAGGLALDTLNAWAGRENALELAEMGGGDAVIRMPMLTYEENIEASSHGGKEIVEWIFNKTGDEGRGAAREYNFLVRQYNELIKKPKLETEEISRIVSEALNLFDEAQEVAA